MSTTDRIADGFLRTNIDLDRYSEGVKNRIFVLLDKAQQEIFAEVARIDPLAPAMSKWREKRLTDLYDRIGQILKSSYGEILKDLKGSLRDVAGFVGEATPKTLNAALGIDLFKVNLTAEFLNAIAIKTMIEGHVIGDWWDKQAQDTKDRMTALINKVSQELSLGLLKGESIGEMISRIRGTALTPGVISLSKAHATTLTRTSVMQVLQSTRMEVYRQNADILNGYQVVATLDKRTTPLCRALDGKRYDMDFKPVGHNQPYPPGPPFHWNCRSTLVPVTKTYEELAEKGSPLSKRERRKVREIDPATRASMGGPVKGYADYNAWLRDQSEEVQRDVLGPKRWKLWKKGLLAMTDLIHQNGRPLTMEQLRKRYGLDG